MLKQMSKPFAKRCINNESLNILALWPFQLSIENVKSKVECALSLCLQPLFYVFD